MTEGEKHMNNSLNNRVPIKGSVSISTAMAMRRGEIESNNGLRKSTGRRSWHSEQPEFELDLGPTVEQQFIQSLKQIGFDAMLIFLYRTAIPACIDILSTECVPAFKRKVHKWMNNEHKTSFTEFENDVKYTESPKNDMLFSDKIVAFDEYRCKTVI